jgi:hypothetical protein
VVHEGREASNNDIPEIKNCPGGGLPVYRFSGYKPSCSRRQDPTLYNPQISTINETFPETNIYKLIADWEGGREKLEIGREGEGEVKSQRRKSDRFIHLSSQFERQNVGGGGGEGKLPKMGSKLDSEILSFWGEGGKREIRKPRKVRVVRRGGGGVIVSERSYWQGHQPMRRE